MRVRLARELAVGFFVGWMASAAFGGEVKVVEKGEAGDFGLVEEKSGVNIFYDAGDAKVVDVAAHILGSDIKRVTGRDCLVLNNTQSINAGALTANAVFMGTLGRSAALDGIIKDNHIDVSGIQGKWESYLITTVPKPNPANASWSLVIIGSDRRGTAYGAMALSEAMGVSPWNWWADVPAQHHESLYVKAGTHVHGPPSVKYRGIFLNDEDWGLQPWAAKTFEPETKDIGPKTYTKIFELLLRLKANFLWPAMHPTTKAFNLYPENKQIADDYGIVMGSSHCEPMLRDNVTEWTDASGRVGEAAAASYNYVTNRQGVLDYWQKRLQENGKFENVYTLGMRGIHDSDMAGGGTTAQRAARLNQIISDQRRLLADNVNKNVEQVPQIFCPYKEVLTLYEAGAVPPDDVTLVWADDNFGYIRRLSTPAEQKRSGGAGVYYHISYWGAPHDYLWLESTPPALIWEELSKAYDYGARTLWVINVGDLKPAEIGITFAMQFAYDASSYTIDNIGQFLPNFAAQTFGPEHAAEIADILDGYYHLNFQRKPEHLGFNTSQNPSGPIQPTEFTDAEIHNRLLAYQILRAKTDALYDALPNEQRDAFYEFAVYPVRCSALQNQKILNIDLYRRAVSSGDSAAAGIAASRSLDAFDRIQKETAYYNNSLATGKWKNIMSANPHNQDVFKIPNLPHSSPVPPELASPLAGRPDIPQSPRAPPTYAELNAYLSIAAESPTRNIPRSNAAWKIIPGLGRLGDSIAVFPTTSPSINPQDARTNSPELQYDFTTTTSADAKIAIQAVPTHRINPERGLRYAIAVDDESPQVVDLETPENSKAWSQNVLRNAAFGTTRHTLHAGAHILHVYMIDPGVVLDHITVDLGGLKPSYLPPSDTLANDVK